MSDFFTPFLLLETLAFVIPCWVTNMSFQFIRAIKDRVSQKNFIRNFKNIDGFDFIFFDGKPLIGQGLRISSIVPILFLPIIFNFFLPITYIHYIALTFFVFTGDLLGSILKRRLNYPKGKFLPLIDHGDYILLAGGVFLFQKIITLEVFICALVLTYILHPLICFLGYKLKIKDQPL